MRQKQLRKALLLVLLSIIDYKRVDTSLYFIITNFFTELKPQVKVSHDMNYPGFTVHSALRTIGKPYCFNKVRLKAEVG